MGEDCWVSQNITVAERDQSVYPGLAPFARVLHDTLVDPPQGWERQRCKAWRWMNIPSSLLSTYIANSQGIDGPQISNSSLLAFVGFTPVWLDSRAVWLD